MYTWHMNALQIARTPIPGATFSFSTEIPAIRKTAAKC